MHSQNFYSDQLLKTIGKEQAGEGSFMAGCRSIIAFLEKENLYVPGTVLFDGSGLSRLNRVSAKQMVEVLYFMGRHPDGMIFFNSLPIGGESGTLSSRFNNTPEGTTVAGSIHGKSGYLGGVNSLAGVITTRKGQTLYYSIIINALDLEYSERLGLIDNIALALAHRDYL